MSPTWSALARNADGCLSWQIRGDEGRSSYYQPRRRQSRRRILAPTLWDGADRGAGFVATAAASRLNVRKLTLAFAETGFSLGLQIVAHYLLRLASRHHPRSATRRARVGLIQRVLSSSHRAAGPRATPRLDDTARRLLRP